MNRTHQLNEPYERHKMRADGPRLTWQLEWECYWGASGKSVEIPDHVTSEPEATHLLCPVQKYHEEGTRYPSTQQMMIESLVDSSERAVEITDHEQFGL